MWPPPLVFFILSRRFSFSPDGFLLSAVFGSPRSVFVLPGWILFSYNDLFSMDNFCSSRIHLVLSGWGWVLFIPDEFCSSRMKFVFTGWFLFSPDEFFSMDKFCSSRMSFVVTGWVLFSPIETWSPRMSPPSPPPRINLEKRVKNIWWLV